MQISAHFTGDMRRTYRATARLRRTANRVFRAIGAVFLLLAVITGTAGGQVGTAVVLAVCGVLIIAEPDVVLWLALRRSREDLVVDVEVEVTDSGISRQTATQRTQAPWEKVRRILETDDFWIFVISRFQNITLYKSTISAAERAELTAFLASRPWQAQEGQPAAR
jgi:hypothetical protein